MQPENVRGVDFDTQIWRVFKPRDLLGDLTKRASTFVRPSMWEGDPYESFLERCDFKLSTGEIKKVRRVLRRFFGQCWTDQKEETDATWRIYAPGRKGIRVRSSVGRLAGAMTGPNYFVGRVTYAPESTFRILTGYTPAPFLTIEAMPQLVDTFFIKRKEFAHEREVRFMFCDTAKRRAKASRHRCPVDPTSVFEEATLDPRMTSAQVKKWTKRLRKAGFEGAISQSSLCRRPAWGKITLL